MPPETDNIEVLRASAIDTVGKGTARLLLGLWEARPVAYPWSNRDPAVLFMALVRDEHFDVELAGRLADGLRVVVQSSAEMG